MRNEAVANVVQDLWKKAIKQQILLIRMDKENQRILGGWISLPESFVSRT